MNDLLCIVWLMAEEKLCFCVCVQNGHCICQVLDVSEEEFKELCAAPFALVICLSHCCP